MLKNLFTWDRIKSFLYAIAAIFVTLGVVDEAVINEAIGGLIGFVAFVLEFFGKDNNNETPAESTEN